MKKQAITKRDLQARVNEATAAAEEAQKRYLDSVRLRTVAVVDEQEAMKEWKRTDIAKRRAMGALAEAGGEEE